MAESVLIAPLHWGLGHASRCIPIIKDEIEQGNLVYISANGKQKALLKEHFPDAQYVDIPFMDITYPKNGNVSLHFALRGPKLVFNIWREHYRLKRVIDRFSIDKVISDSRFGLWNKHAKSVFITHQVDIKTPFFQSAINSINRWVMNHYDEVWIPDYEEKPGLAGELSHPAELLENSKYIGPLSRFNKKLQKESHFKYDVLAMISGPEPQRTLFEIQLRKQFQIDGKKALILKGNPKDKESFEDGDITTKNHLLDEELLVALSQSKEVHARSGYSTIMDFHALGIGAKFYPTPGQTEQEYLAELHQNK